ncbi:TMM81 protein, partial [Zapornia atra]|nr:TMM81 protein [Zapornia atra]
MKTSGSSHVLGILSGAFYLQLVVAFRQVNIPAELGSVGATVTVNTTSCSATCGLGFKLEELCEVTPAGERRNCTVRRTGCLTNWVCGLFHFTVPQGKASHFSCLSSDEVRLGSRAYSYTWGFAQGLITTKDGLFRPFRTPHAILRFSHTTESDAGTYRCDVQMVETSKVIRRVYFGVRVIPNDLADLNFQKSLTWEQKLAANEAGGSRENSTHEEVQEQQDFWQGELFYRCLVALGGGLMGGAVVSVALYSLQKMLR